MNISVQEKQEQHQDKSDAITSWPGCKICQYLMQLIIINYDFSGLFVRPLCRCLIVNGFFC